MADENKENVGAERAKAGAELAKKINADSINNSCESHKKIILIDTCRMLSTSIPDDVGIAKFKESLCSGLAYTAKDANPKECSIEEFLTGVKPTPAPKVNTDKNTDPKKCSTEKSAENLFSKATAEFLTGVKSKPVPESEHYPDNCSPAELFSLIKPPPTSGKAPSKEGQERD